jgi:hypothetical protein
MPFPAAAPPPNTKVTIDDREFVWSNRWDLTESSQLDKGGLVGEIAPFISGTAPTGWLPCEGRTFLAADYPALQRVLNGLVTPHMEGYFVRMIKGGAAPRAVLSIEAGATVRDPHWSYPGRSVRTQGGGRHNHYCAPGQSVTGWYGSTDAKYFTQDPLDGGRVDINTGEGGTHGHTVSSEEIRPAGWDAEASRPTSISVIFYIRGKLIN